LRQTLSTKTFGYYPFLRCFHHENSDGIRFFYLLFC
jgi:hypothetical protein